jgi:hypothetical protein
VVDAGERLIAVASEQVQWPPAQCHGLGGPAAVQERPAIVYELVPPPLGHIVRRLREVQAGEPIRPLAYRDKAPRPSPSWQCARW